MTRPVVHRDGTVTIDGREVGEVYRHLGDYRHPGHYWHAMGKDNITSHATRRDAVAALVRADEGATDAR